MAARMRPTIYAGRGHHAHAPQDVCVTGTVPKPRASALCDDASRRWRDAKTKAENDAAAAQPMMLMYISWNCVFMRGPIKPASAEATTVDTKGNNHSDGMEWILLSCFVIMSHGGTVILIAQSTTSILRGGIG